MKKNQSKSKSKVEERKSVANQCDYSRNNGKCGRALCDNYGKPCLGRSCVDWDCEAEDEVAARASDEATNCEFNRQPYGYCMNTKSKHYSNSCHKCKVFKEKCDAEGTAVAVVEPSGGAVGMTDQDVAAGITRQLQVIEDAEKNAQLERVKLGVVLIRWEQYLGDGRGRGAGGGLKGWLEANVPSLGYDAALSFKKQAKQAVEMLGGGAKAQAVLLDEPTVTQPDGEVIEIEADYVAKRDKIFEDVKSRRQLEQTYFKFMASEGKGRAGRPKGTGAGEVTYKKKSSMECAVEAVWPTVQHLLKHRGEMFTAYKILPDEKLTEFRDTLTEHVKAIEAVLAGRER